MSKPVSETQPGQNATDDDGTDNSAKDPAKLAKALHAEKVPADAEAAMAAELAAE
ncbi:hypothetical protein LTR36_009984 [Oleoguttula mirabilis]|uniref:Uncharacterized protein n=1 Tax=Oleoguttula mirabilis TaxID=1507867 RepID=A0AAV9J5P3_9PEZI|nr:hypothetical protein LTR36_009984 [Oleoguttula mirabilis]